MGLESGPRYITFIITRVSVSATRMESSYNTNDGNTWKPVVNTETSLSLCVKTQQESTTRTELGLTNRGKEDDGQEVPDWLDAPHDLCGVGVSLCGQQSPGQETAQLHRNVQEVRHLWSRAEGK